MNLISLGKFATVDDEDFDRVNQFNWYAHQINKSWYAERSVRISMTKKKNIIRLQRFILGIMNPLIDIDHKDRDGLNCQKDNLRVCKYTGQNNQNQGLRKDNTTGFKGVHFNKKRHRWTAQICVNGHIDYLGCFKHPIDAALAYDAVAKDQFGEFAFLNFKE